MNRQEYIECFAFGAGSAEPRFMSHYQLVGAALFFSAWTGESPRNTMAAAYLTRVHDFDVICAAVNMLEDLLEDEGTSEPPPVCGYVVGSDSAPFVSGEIYIG